MSKVNYDEIQVGDLVELTFDNSGIANVLGFVTKVTEEDFSAIWSDDFKEDSDSFDGLVGHWKVINFEEESKVDELKVYTGKDAFKELLNGKIMNNGVSDFKFEGEDLLVKTGKDWSKCYGAITHLLEYQFTEVVLPQVGDWVKVNHNGKSDIGEIIHTKDSIVYAYWNNEDYEDGHDLSYNDIDSWEILSPEQITEYKREQVFSKVGRKVDEYRENDIVFLKNTGTICMVTRKNNVSYFVGVKEINKPQKWDAKVNQLTPISFAENLVSSL
ncbi:hypothetical protein [Bacillus wiedmannii]|uniref:hypothetical protein n=1 Tax=Bacillus wiedmannii TaxID=1890302 RepID=UPI000BF00D1A|nr:hypothetical protein [Bacillus wiedmannii]PEM30188.1 hypothetical protein CN598_12750 [Bacillus wiedmannii]